MSASVPTVAGYSGVTASGSGFTGAAPVVSAQAEQVPDYGTVIADQPVTYPGVASYPITEQTAVPTAAPEPDGDTSRYAYEWDIGPTSPVVTAEKAMAVMKASPNVVFPFEVRGLQGETTIQEGHSYDLRNARIPGDGGNFVLVTQSDATSFTFRTMSGHFRGPGRTIRFQTVESGGRLILRQEGVSAMTLVDELYDLGARVSWRYQAANLRAALFGGERADFPGSFSAPW